MRQRGQQSHLLNADNRLSLNLRRYANISASLLTLERQQEYQAHGEQRLAEQISL